MKSPLCGNSSLPCFNTLLSVQTSYPTFHSHIAFSSSIDKETFKLMLKNKIFSVFSSSKNVLALPELRHWKWWAIQLGQDQDQYSRNSAYFFIPSQSFSNIGFSIQKEAKENVRSHVYSLKITFFVEEFWHIPSKYLCSGGRKSLANQRTPSLPFPVTMSLKWLHPAKIG